MANEKLTINPAEGGVPKKTSKELYNKVPLVSAGDQDTAVTIAKVGANVANTLLYISGGLTIIFILLSSAQLITAAGDQGKIDSAKRHLVNALLGAAIITLSLFIVRLIHGSLVNGITPSK